MKRYVKRNFGKRGSKIVLLVFFVLLIALSVWGGFYVFYFDEEAMTPPVGSNPVSGEIYGTYTFKILNKSINLNVGEHKKVKIQSDDKDASKAMEWTSSDDKVAHIDPDGNIVALKKGKATITAKAGYYSSQCKVTVKDNSKKDSKTFSTAYTANEDVVKKNKANTETSAEPVYNTYDNYDVYSEYDVDGDSIGTETYTTYNNKMLYSIKVNRLKNCVTVYTYDNKGKYTVPVRAMICSCGADDGTPEGSFSIFAKNRWHPLFGNVYGQYTSAFNNSILFHSVPYEEMEKPDTVEVGEYNNLGKSVSMGCVRLAVADAKWIYDNCPEGTTVEVYEDKKDGPLGTPPAMKINSDKSVGWDPTDDDKNNPYYNSTPTFEGVVNASVDNGEYFDPMKGVKAKDSSGTDVTDKIKITGKVNENKSGEYIIIYYIKDNMNRTKTQYRYVTVR